MLQNVLKILALRACSDRETMQRNRTVRPATVGDAALLAELINYAGEGLPLYLWGEMAEPGESAWDVGRRRAAREEDSFLTVTQQSSSKMANVAVASSAMRSPRIQSRSRTICRQCSYPCKS
jgi:hypothetical protein